MQDEDKELQLLKAKKMFELRKRLSQKIENKPKPSREILLSRLVDRGLEVLKIAEATYPRDTKVIIEKLVELISNGSIKENISGGELLSLLRAIGLNIHIETKILIEKDGKLVSLADRLKRK